MVLPSMAGHSAPMHVTAKGTSSRHSQSLRHSWTTCTPASSTIKAALYEAEAAGCLQVGSFGSWLHILHKDQLLWLAPTVASTAALWATMKFARHPGTLPVVLVVIPLAFHGVLLATRTSLAEAADQGWVMQPEVRPGPGPSVMLVLAVLAWPKG